MPERNHYFLMMRCWLLPLPRSIVVLVFSLCKLKWSAKKCSKPGLQKSLLALKNDLLLEGKKKGFTVEFPLENTPPPRSNYLDLLRTC